MSQPIYRFATLADLEQLVELRVLMQTEVNHPPKEEEKYRESLREFFSRALPAGDYVSAVAEVEGRLIAASGLVIYNRPPSVLGGVGLRGDISNVYTRP